MAMEAAVLIASSIFSTVVVVELEELSDWAVKELACTSVFQFALGLLRLIACVQCLLLH